MDSNAINLEHLQSRTAELEKGSTRLNIIEVFGERRGSYVNEFLLFIAHFNSIPNLIQEINIDCRKASAWLNQIYKEDIKNQYYSKRYFKRSKIAQYDDMIYIIYDDLIVDFDTSQSVVRFLFRKTDILKVDIIIAGVKKFKERKAKRTPEISLLVNFLDGVGTKSFKISKPTLNIADNYNDDFKEIHAIIFRRLSKENDKGLVLLHGKPGTGKTSYIRYLIASLKKKVIFLPPDMAGAITNPNLVSVLIDHPNSIFVIEDTENIIVDREKDGNSQLSVLLNISYGLLSDCLNIQIICSFNIDISKVDSALLRKGRLIAKYEFKELEAVTARSLSRKLGFATDYNSPVTLAAIYNQGDREFIETRKNQIGFKAI